jgi:hypothetical protein
LFEKLQRIDGSLKDELQYFNESKKNILQFADLDTSVINRQFGSDDFQITANGTDSIGGDLYHHRRRIGDGEILFLSNADMVSSSKGNVTIKGKDALLMDPATGAIEDYPEQVNGDKIMVNFDIAPAGSLMLFVANEKQQGVRMHPSLKNKSVIKGSETKVVRPAENTLMIDFCDVQLRDTLLKDTHVGVASRAVFVHNGFSRNPWNHQVQFKDHIVARDTFSKGTGYTAMYHFVIDGRTNYKQFRAVVEQGNLWNRITINGKEVKPVAGKWWLDRSFAVLQIGEYLNPGENTLSLTIDPMSVYAEIEPVYILGDFNLASADKGWKIVSPRPLQLGSWKDQGLPLYGSGIRYIKKFDIKDPDHQFEIQLDQWKGTVAAIKVNGVPAGIIFSEPNTINISPHLKKGINELEVEVIGSLKNLLGPHHNSPQPGMVGPGHWSNVKTYPPGKDYDTYDYGLMTDFQLFKYDN